MADLDDITALILRAQVVEASNPGKAHAWYEVAERDLDNYLIAVFGISRDALTSNPDTYLSKRFMPYYNEIEAGYGRLIANKEAHASSL